MEKLGYYILSVTAATILLSVLQSVAGKKGTYGALLRLIGGLFLSFTIIAPVADIEPDQILEFPWDFAAQGSDIAERGQEYAQDQLHGIIKDRCEAYILDKAKAYQADLTVEVMLSLDEVPVPSSVRLQGSVSPYARQALQKWLQDDIGIPKECQQWIG